MKQINRVKILKDGSVEIIEVMFSEDTDKEEQKQDAGKNTKASRKAKKA